MGLATRLVNLVAFKKAVVDCRGRGKHSFVYTTSLLAACVLCYGLGALADSMLGKFTGKEKPDGGLDFPRSDRCLLVVVGETRGFLSNPFEDVVDKRVHDAHGLA